MGFFKKLREDKRGNVLMLFGLSLPALLGTVGLAAEGAQWYKVKRDLQNAADQAVVAAATNATASGYLNEARAVSAGHGLLNGANNVTVAASNAATCPTGGTTCYSVTITKKVPLIFSKIIGYVGNTLIGTTKAVSISATAVAKRDMTPREYCILALATSGESVAFDTNGAPNANLTGCNIMSNSGMTCSGHDLDAEFGDAAGTNSGCGNTRTSNMPQVSDPYRAKAANIPTNTCTAYPQATPGNGNGANAAVPPPASNRLSGALTYPSGQTFCGDVWLTGNVTLSGSSNVIVIRNGDLNLNGYSITTASGAGATIIFAGENNAAYSHIPTGNGEINIAAPTSGDWAGVAMYQDPNLTTGVDISDAGNSPTWNITGLTYLPNSNVIFSGVVGKATNGKSCFIFVVDTIRINGTGSIAARGQCDEAGVTPPSNPVPDRGKLVA